VLVKRGDGRVAGFRGERGWSLRKIAVARTCLQGPRDVPCFAIHGDVLVNSPTEIRVRYVRPYGSNGTGTHV
jgi:hypothetical protein